ncbi:MAG: hypothetical protein R3F07_20780 [Opitutaceae bacterium]
MVGYFPAGADEAADCLSDEDNRFYAAFGRKKLAGFRPSEQFARVGDGMSFNVFTIDLAGRGHRTSWMPDSLKQAIRSETRSTQ